MFTFALLVASAVGHADFTVCPLHLQISAVDLPDRVPNPEFDNPKSDDLKPSDDGPVIPDDKPVIDPAPAPVERPLPTPEPLERPPDEK